MIIVVACSFGSYHGEASEGPCGITWPRFLLCKPHCDAVVLLFLLFIEILQLST